jgi:hypothetical protein
MPCWGSVAVEPQSHRRRETKCTDALGLMSFGSDLNLVILVDPGRIRAGIEGAVD